jgi:hypothetical protein
MGVESADSISVHWKVAACEFGRCGAGKGSDQDGVRSVPFHGASNLTGKIGRLSGAGGTEDPVLRRFRVVPLSNFIQCAGGALFIHCGFSGGARNRPNFGRVEVRCR